MINIVVDAGEILRFTRRLSSSERGIERALAQSLNETGDAAVSRAVSGIASETGLDAAAASRLVSVRRATPKNLEYTVRINYGAAEDDRLSRGLPNRRGSLRRDETPFQSEVLVDIITAGDDNVCPICEEIAENGPYDPQELARLKSMHPHFLNPVLNCRCAIHTFRPRGRMKVTSRTEQTSGFDKQVTLNQLAQAIRQNVTTVLRVKK